MATEPNRPDGHIHVISLWDHASSNGVNLATAEIGRRNAEIDNYFASLTDSAAKDAIEAFGLYLERHVRRTPPSIAIGDNIRSLISPISLEPFDFNSDDRTKDSWVLSSGHTISAEDFRHLPDSTCPHTRIYHPRELVVRNLAIENLVFRYREFQLSLRNGKIPDSLKSTDGIGVFQNPLVVLKEIRSNDSNNRTKLKPGTTINVMQALRQGYPLNPGVNVAENHALRQYIADDMPQEMPQRRT